MVRMVRMVRILRILRILRTTLVLSNLMSGSHTPAEIMYAESDGLKVIFDSCAYDLVSIQKAAYKFGDKCHILVNTDEDKHVIVRLSAKRIIDNPRFLAGEFCNEVLDQHLRKIVLEETSGIRDLLLAQAFSKTNLICPDLDSSMTES